MTSNDKSPNALRTIGEVAEELGIAPHVLRFWESKFRQIRPQKRRGRRYYRPEDIQVVSLIKVLLYGKGYTIRGVQKFLSEHKVKKSELLQAANSDGQEQNSAVQEVMIEGVRVQTDLFGNVAQEGHLAPANSDLSPSDFQELEKIYNRLRSLREKINNAA